ncbi:MAG: hypothetical protein ACRDZY_12615 [Acidimicrobiales bacterium]
MTLRISITNEEGEVYVILKEAVDVDARAGFVWEDDDLGELCRLDMVIDDARKWDAQGVRNP